MGFSKCCSFRPTDPPTDPSILARSAALFLGTVNPDGGPLVITPVYKRWTRERSPPELYNHGFENMESLGAVYSRVSSHIFGDWNACGERAGLVLGRDGLGRV